MSMKSYANSCWEIPASVLEQNFPDDHKFLMDNESEFSDWLQDSEVDEELSTRFTSITESFVKWCAEKGLEVGFDYRCADEDNDDMALWMIFCENAITINPAFTAIGGTQVLYTTFG